MNTLKASIVSMPFFFQKEIFFCYLLQVADLEFLRIKAVLLCFQIILQIDGQTNFLMRLRAFCTVENLKNNILSQNSHRAVLYGWAYFTLASDK